MSKSEQVLVDDKIYSIMSVREGGMGRVWLLEQTFQEPLDMIYRPRIAVKTFDFMRDQNAVEHELNIWISLVHPAILPLKKIGRLNYQLAAIMPWLQGNLDDILDARGTLSEEEVVRVISEVVTGLDYAWTKFKILHLDLKPSNLLLETSSPIRTKIADWGISRLAAENRLARGVSVRPPTIAFNDNITAYSSGTPLFMAPERFSGNWRLTPVADIYSLGMIAIQLNTGVIPFRFGQVDPAEEIATGSFFDNARQMLEDRSEGFRHFCLQCIHPDPALRTSTYREVLDKIKVITAKGA